MRRGQRRSCSGRSATAITCSARCRSHKVGERPLSPGDWRCYITDVIKSPERVKEHAGQPHDAFLAAADAWAAVLSWELKWGRPRIVASVGDTARSLLNHLIGAGKIPDPLEWDGWRTHIPHYVYVASRPENRRGLPGEGGRVPRAVRRDR